MRTAQRKTAVGADSNPEPLVVIIKPFPCKKISLRIEVGGSIRVSQSVVAYAGRTVTSWIK